MYTLCLKKIRELQNKLVVIVKRLPTGKHSAGLYNSGPMRGLYLNLQMFRIENH